MGYIRGSCRVLLQHSLLSQASRDLAQMNDLQAQLEEANKEKQELQEKVGTGACRGRERVARSPYMGMKLHAHGIVSTSLCHRQSTEQRRVQRELGLEPRRHSRRFGFSCLISHFSSLPGPRRSPLPPKGSVCASAGPGGGCLWLRAPFFHLPCHPSLLPSLLPSAFWSPW